MSDTPKWKRWLSDIRNSFAKHPDEAYLKQVQRAQPKKHKVQAKPGEQPLVSSRDVLQLLLQSL